MKFLLYHHKTRAFADYVKEFSNLKELDTEILSLPQQNAHKSFAELPASLRRLLYFAKPDLVICMDDGKEPVRPVFALELTEHVPARDHWMQRFPNLVGCAQEGIPGAYVMPFSMLERENFEGRTDSFFFFAYDRVMEIHQTPIYIAEWAAPDGKSLETDIEFPSMPNHNSKGMLDVFNFLNVVLDSSIHGRKFVDIMRDRLFVDLRNKIRTLAYTKIPEINEFGRLRYNMSNNRFLTLEELKIWVEGKGLLFPSKILPDRIAKRDKNLIYVPQSNRKKKTDEQLRETLIERIAKRGGDPYTGVPLAFDYLFCRLGPTTYERDCNLVIDLSLLYFSDLAQYHHEIWEKSPLQYTEFNKIKNDIPRYTMYLTEGSAQVIKNFLRIYAFTADIIVFKDGLIYF